MKFSDSEIIRALLEGNDDAVLSYLYKKVLPKVKHYINNNKGNEDEAKDIFQDAVLIFYKKVKKNELDDKTNITAYICLVAKNLWINRVKKINRTVEFSHDLEKHTDDSLLKDLITEEKKFVINKLLSDIGEECKKLLRYSIYDNYSMRKICQLMGYSSENVAKTYNYRCKQKLIQVVMKNKAVVNLLKNES